MTEETKESVEIGTKKASTAMLGTDRKDVNNGRGRWWHKSLFIAGSIGASIGLPNIWKFPYYTFKHSGPYYIIAYFLAMIFVGWPMHLLESTLG